MRASGRRVGTGGIFESWVELSSQEPALSLPCRHEGKSQWFRRTHDRAKDQSTLNLAGQSATPLASVCNRGVLPSCLDQAQPGGHPSQARSKTLSTCDRSAWWGLLGYAVPKHSGLAHSERCTERTNG